MGGVGKSQIAIEHVYRNSRDYQLIWWIPSEQTNLIVQSLIELGEQMGLRAGATEAPCPRSWRRCGSENPTRTGSWSSTTRRTRMRSGSSSE